MAYVYIIQDEITGRYYTGSCVDLPKRLLRHQHHTGGTTTKKGEWKLVRYRVCDNIGESRVLEKLVKSYKGGNAFKKIISGVDEQWRNDIGEITSS